MDFKSYTLIALLFASVIMGAGAFYQHRQYLAISKQYESLVGANKSLVEAAKTNSKVDEVKQKASARVTEVIVEKTRVVEQQKQKVDAIVAQGNTDEKDFMSRPLPPDLVRVLDLAYQGTYQGRD